MMLDPATTATLATRFALMTTELAAFQALYHARSFSLTMVGEVYHVEFIGKDGYAFAFSAPGFLEAMTELAAAVSKRYLPEATGKRLLEEMERLQDEQKRSYPTE